MSLILTLYYLAYFRLDINLVVHIDVLLNCSFVFISYNIIIIQKYYVDEQISPMTVRLLVYALIVILSA